MENKNNRQIGQQFRREREAKEKTGFNKVYYDTKTGGEVKDFIKLLRKAKREQKKAKSTPFRVYKSIKIVLYTFLLKKLVREYQVRSSKVMSTRSNK